MSDWEAFKAKGIPGRLEAARLGLNPTAIARMPSGWAVVGDNQFIPGYALLLADPLAPSLNALPLEGQMAFLRDLALLGRALEDVTRCARVNYAIFANFDPFLHAHLWARYAWEPDEYRRGVVSEYPRERRDAPEHQFSEDRHGALRARLKVRLLELMA